MKYDLHPFKYLYYLTLSTVLNSVTIFMLNSIGLINAFIMPIILIMSLFSFIAFAKGFSNLPKLWLQIMEYSTFFWHSFISSFPFLYLICLFIDWLCKLNNIMTYLSLSISLIYTVMAAWRLINPKFKCIYTQLRVNKSFGNQKEIKIIAVSDLHINTVFSTRMLKQMIEKVNNESADILLIAGDIFSLPINLLIEKIEVLTQLKAKEGIYFVSGNDDFTYDYTKIKDKLKRELKWISLGDNLVKINNLNLTLLGAEDPCWQIASHSKESSLFILENQNITALNKDEVNVFVYHRNNPKLLIKYQNIDLQVSGHTHAGQAWPLTWINAITNKYIKGNYTINRKQYLYVSQGCGYSNPPLHRLGTDLEIAVLTLKN
eukprot:COSAG01_NODE_14_length_41020_cov_40.702133_42_plen_375_part_00